MNKINKNLTIKDIAKLANVSCSTVSRVIHNKNDVNEKTKKTVLEIIQHTGYAPSKHALITRGTMTINKILILPTRIDSYSEIRTIRGVFSAIHSNDEVVIRETNFNLNFIYSIIENSPSFDKYIIFYIPGINLDFFSNIKDKVMFVGTNVEGYSSIYCDNRPLFNDFLNQLFSQYSFEKVMYFGLKSKYDSYRLETIQAFCKNKGISLKTYEVSFDYQHIHEQLKSIPINSPDFILCSTDTIAVSVYKKLISGNQTIPIAGTGNNKYLSSLIENYNTVDFHEELWGKKIIENIHAGNNYFNESMPYEILLNLNSDS